MKFSIALLIIINGLFSQSQFSGNANFSYGNRTNDGSILRLPYRMLELKYIHETENFSLKSEFAFEWNRKMDSDFLSDNNPQDFILDLRELFLAWYIPVGEIKIGKQIHSWGFVDENSPLDNLNALDYYYLFDGGAARKVGSYSMASNLYWNNFSFNLVYSPFHNASRLPIVNGNADDEFPFEFPFIPLKNEILFDNPTTEIGFAISYAFSNGDLMFSKFSAHDRIFNFSGINIFTNDFHSFHDTDLVFGYRKTEVIGLGGQYLIGNLNIRMDYGLFNTKDINKIVEREHPHFPNTWTQIALFDSTLQSYPMQEEVKYSQFNIQLEYELPFEISLISQYFQYNLNDFSSNNLPIDQDIEIPNFELDVSELSPENLFIPGMGSPLAVLTERSLLFNVHKNFLDNQLKINLSSLLDITNKPNGYFDLGEEFTDNLFESNNQTWDIGGIWIDGYNGIYDEGEDWVDLNNDGLWNEGEEFIDQLNSNWINGIYDEGEIFIDLTGDGLWNEGEEFIDQINLDWVNDAYDDGEYWIDSNNDGIWNEGEEFFDGYNGIYDDGEFFTDLVGNGYWEDGEQFIDKKNDEFRIYGKLFTLGMEFDLSENVQFKFNFSKIIGSDYYSPQANYQFNLMEEFSNIRLDLKYSF